MQKTTERLVLEACERYSGYEGPLEELPYVERVRRRGEVPPERFASEINGAMD